MRHCGKLFLMESRIECHSKTIDFPFDRSGEFHNHNGYEVLLLLGGEINLYTEYGGTHMRPGDLVCIPAYEFHRAELLTERQYDRVVINILDTELPAKCTRSDKPGRMFSAASGNTAACGTSAGGRGGQLLRLGGRAGKKPRGG